MVLHECLCGAQLLKVTRGRLKRSLNVPAGLPPTPLICFDCVCCMPANVLPHVEKQEQY